MNTNVVAPIIRSFAVLAMALEVTVSAASAQSSQSVPPSTGGTSTPAAAPAVTSPAHSNDTMVQYRNVDPLHGIYTQKPVFSQCADNPVVGPMAEANTGSLAAEPLYNFMTDFDLTGIPCEKPL